MSLPVEHARKMIVVVTAVADGRPVLVVEVEVARKLKRVARAVVARVDVSRQLLQVCNRVDEVVSFARRVGAECHCADFR